MTQTSLLFTTLTSLAFATAISGCADDGVPLGSSVDTTNVSAFCRASAQTECNTMYACLTAAEREDMDLPMTVAECERERESHCENLVESCDDNIYAYSPNNAASCLDEMQVAACNDAAEPWLDAPSCKEVCHRIVGALAVAWQFSPAYSCYDLGVYYVDVVSSGPKGTFKDRFDCTAGGGTTADMPFGAYDVHIELFDASGVRRWMSSAVSAALDDGIVDVGTITVPVR